MLASSVRRQGQFRRNTGFRSDRKGIRFLILVTTRTFPVLCYTFCQTCFHAQSVTIQQLQLYSLICYFKGRKGGRGGTCSSFIQIKDMPTYSLEIDRRQRVDSGSSFLLMWCLIKLSVYLKELLSKLFLTCIREMTCSNLGRGTG
jgi:hypothetical protein